MSTPSNDSGEFRMPKFEPDVPELVLEQFPDKFQRHMLQTESVQRQQNEHIMRQQHEIKSRLSQGDERFEVIEKQVTANKAEAIAAAKEIKDSLSGLTSWFSGFKTKKKFALFLLSALVLPCCISIFGSWVGEWIKRFFK